MIMYCYVVFSFVNGQREASLFDIRRKVVCWCVHDLSLYEVTGFVIISITMFLAKILRVDTNRNVAAKYMDKK